MERSHGVVLLSGGMGRRMGYTDKSQLLYQGESFADRILKEFSPLGLPFFLSVRQGIQGGQISDRWNCRRILDDIPGAEAGEQIGPMGGILSCLTQTGLDGLFFVPCDMPLARKAMAERLMEKWTPDYDAVLWKTRDGRLQPLCGFYARTCVETLKSCIEEGNYRMMNFLSRISVLVLETEQEHIPDHWFMNVNHQEAYEELMGRTVPILAVSGRKDTGKTTFLESLVKGLSKRGIRAAVIKHDGHDFEADVPGTDSFRMKQAGAFGTVVYSGSKFSIVKDRENARAEEFFSCFPEADIILLEGQKYSAYPKFEILRSEKSRTPVCDPSTVISYVTDGGWKPEQEKNGENGEDRTAEKSESIQTEIPVLSWQQTEEALEMTVLFMDRSKENENRRTEHDGKGSF